MFKSSIVDEWQNSYTKIDIILEAVEAGIKISAQTTILDTSSVKGSSCSDVPLIYQKDVWWVF